MTLGTFFWLIVGKKIGLKERQLIMADQNQMQLSGAVKLLKQIIEIFLVIEFIGALILGIWFLKYEPDLASAMLNGLFMSISATTNAGFEPQPLAQIVSGGELSRISLAIHSVSAEKSAYSTFIFDEVDVGARRGE